MRTSITLMDLELLRPADIRALGSILHVYGADLVSILRGRMLIVLPVELAPAFLATVSRDVWPIELQENR